MYGTKDVCVHHWIHVHIWAIMCLCTARRHLCMSVCITTYTYTYAHLCVSVCNRIDTLFFRAECRFIVTLKSDGFRFPLANASYHTSGARHDGYASAWRAKPRPSSPSCRRSQVCKHTTRTCTSPLQERRPIFDVEFWLRRHRLFKRILSNSNLEFWCVSRISKRFSMRPKSRFLCFT